MDRNEQNVWQAGEMVQSFMTIYGVLVRFSAQNAGTLGLSLQQMGILNMINSCPQITLTEIADKLSLPKSTVSVNVDGLVQSKLAERKINEANRREIHFTLTAQGTELSQKSSQNAYSYRAMAMALEKMPQEDVEDLVRMHRELLNVLRECRF